MGREGESANAILGEEPSEESGLVESDDFVHARELELSGEDDGAIEIVTSDTRAHLYGRIVNVPGAATLSQPFSAISTPREAREQNWAVSLQQQNNPLTVVEDTVVALVKYGQGQATFTKRIPMTGMQPVKVVIPASYVEVSFFYLFGTSVANAVVSVSAVPGDYTGPDFYAWQRFEAPAAATTDHLLLTNLPGVLGRCHVTMWVAAGAVTFWPLLFDQATGAAPAPGAKPILGGRMPTVKNVGDESVLADDFSPGSLQWSTGLLVALSQRPDIYQAPAAGNQIWSDLKVGY